jgi:DNA-binding beta-propeller fold protein YncE/plastocyanin
LISSSLLFLLPSAYSQEQLSFLPLFREGGPPGPKLFGPAGIAVDPSSGNVYVAVTAVNRIQVFSSDGTFVSNWGRFGGAQNGTFSHPQGIAIDPEGNVYVADTGNNRIQVFTSNGTYISKFPSVWGEFGPRDGRLTSPEDVAIDPSSGNVYVADTGNNRIQVFTSNGSIISKWGEHGTTDGMLRSPAGIAVDPSSGNVYVADTGNNRIQVFTSNGTYISKWGEHGTTDGMLRSPAGIAVDPSSGNVYVADKDNHRIQVFTSNGTFISKVGIYGFMQEGMRFPQDVTIDPSSGNVYVADTASDRILGFATRSPITNMSFSGEEGEVYGNNTRIKIETVYDGLRFPTAIAFLGPDDMLVVQKTNNSIMRIVNGQMLDEPVLDLGNNISSGAGVCLCDIALLQNGNGTTYAFLYYYLGQVTAENGTKKIVNRLYRYDVTDGKFTNPKLIFEIPSHLGAPHNGGKLMVGPDNNVYLTIGDVKHYRTQAQNWINGSLPDGSSGILRFTPNGDPVDGGLLGNTHPLDKYYAYGVRNPFGLNYDPFTGNIWMTDNGPASFDEINIVSPGFNGGWRKIMGLSSLREGFNLTALEFFNGTGKYHDPIFSWRETLGVTDLIFIPSDNKLGKEYEGNLFVADNNNGHLYRFLLNQSRTGLLLNGSLSDGVANTNIENLYAVFAKINGGAVTDLEIGPDGLLYIVSFGDGKIMRLEPIDASVTLPLIETNTTETAPVGTSRTPTTNATETGNTTETAGATTITAAGGNTTANTVSIVPDSSALTDTAYQPNPLQINVGDTVTWTNDDLQPHTVTSGEDATPDGRLDSSIMAPGATFSHTFTEAGEYPYFCLLHPNMIGTVSVS